MDFCVKIWLRFHIIINEYVMVLLRFFNLQSEYFVPGRSQCFVFCLCLKSGIDKLQYTEGITLATQICCH